MLAELQGTPLPWAGNVTTPDRVIFGGANAGGSVRTTQPQQAITATPFTGRAQARGGAAGMDTSTSPVLGVAHQRTGGGAAPVAQTTTNTEGGLGWDRPRDSRRSRHTRVQVRPRRHRWQRVRGWGHRREGQRSDTRGVPQEERTAGWLRATWGWAS